MNAPSGTNEPLELARGITVYTVFGMVAFVGVVIFFIMI